MIAGVNNMGIRRFLKRGVVSSALMLLATGCMTGESTFQDQQAELLSFGDPDAAWIGEVNSWDETVEKSLQAPTAAQSIVVSPLGKFVFEVPKSWNTDQLRARVQQPASAALTLLDIDGRVGAAPWCLNDAADFVAPRARMLRAESNPLPEQQASEELYSALSFVIINADALRFDQTCLSQGDTEATRAMALISFVIWELRNHDLDAFLIERDAFAQTGQLSAETVMFMREAAEKTAAGSTALETLLRQRASAPEAKPNSTPDYARIFDFDEDGVPDFYRTCDPQTDDECSCVSENPDLCRCGNGIVEPGERCEPDFDGPGCDDECGLLSECGDGVVDGSERYDSGPACAGLDCHPEVCDLDADSCKGWLKHSFPTPLPVQAWRLQDGELRRLVRREEERIVYEEGASPVLESTGPALVVQRSPDFEGLLILPGPSEGGHATLWQPNDVFEEIMFTVSNGSTHDQIQCATVLKSTPANEARVVLGWGGGTEEGVELQEWRLVWAGGNFSAERVRTTVSTYESCSWLAPHDAGFVVGHKNGVSYWKSVQPDGEQLTWQAKDYPPSSVTQLKDKLLLWDSSGLRTVDEAAGLEDVDVCLPLSAELSLAPASHRELLSWARPVDAGPNVGLELGFIAPGDAWLPPAQTFLAKDVSGHVFVGQALGVWVGHGATSAFYEYTP